MTETITRCPECNAKYPTATRLVGRFGSQRWKNVCPNSDCRMILEIRLRDMQYADRRELIQDNDDHLRKLGIDPPERCCYNMKPAPLPNV